MFTVKYKKENPNTGQINVNLGYHHSHNIIITDSTDVTESINTEINVMLEQVSQFQKVQSGWQFEQVEHFDIDIDPFQPLGVSSYIPTPKNLAPKQPVINIKNKTDNECFKWAVTSEAFPKKIRPERLNDEMRENSKHFDWTGIEFPVSPKNIDKFEKQNPYAINV